MKRYTAVNEPNKHVAYKHLTFMDRCRIEALSRENWTIKGIAQAINCAESTVRNELKRSGLSKAGYNAITAQKDYKSRRDLCHRPNKFSQCQRFVGVIVKNYNEHKWSIDATVGRLKMAKAFRVQESACTQTVYNWLHEGRIAGKKIPRRRPKHHQVRHIGRLFPGGLSIEHRPQEALDRNNFGHWEIDTVIGEKRGKNKVLLTITERSTDYTLLRLLDGKNARSVDDTLAKVLKELGSRVKTVCKTITADNGREFATFHMVCKEADTKGFFAHPYAAHERGINERQNRIVRLFVPKGMSINDLTEDDVTLIEEKMNGIPRKIFNYKTPEELFGLKMDEIYAPIT